MVTTGAELLADLRDQFEQMMNMGGLGAMLDKLPIPGNVNAAALKDGVGEQQMRRQIAIINSMTPSERRFPKTINGSRKKRIAQGCGLQVQDVNRLLKQFTQMERMMKKMSRGGMKKMMRGMGGPWGMGGGGGMPGMQHAGHGTVIGGVLAAVWGMLREKPDVVVGFGGGRSPATRVAGRGRGGARTATGNDGPSPRPWVRRPEWRGRGGHPPHW